MSKRIPERWFVGAQNDALYIIDRRPAQDNDYPNHEADCATIAKVYDDVRGDHDSGRKHARLIAAAPTLLSAAEQSLALLEKGAPGWGVAKDLLRAAIHEAKNGRR